MNTIYSLIESFELNNNIILLEDSIEIKGNLHDEYQCKSYKLLKIRLIKVKYLKEYNYYIYLTSKCKILMNSSMNLNPKLNSFILNPHCKEMNTLYLSISSRNILRSDLLEHDDKQLYMKFLDEESYKKWQLELSNILIKLHCNTAMIPLPSGRLSIVKMNQCIQYCKLLLPYLKLQDKFIYKKLERLYTVRIKLNEVIKALQRRSNKLNLEDIYQIQQICLKSIRNNIDIELETDPDVIFLCTKLSINQHQQYDVHELENICKSIGYYDEMEEMENNQWEWEGIDSEVIQTSTTLIDISPVVYDSLTIPTSEQQQQQQQHPQSIDPSTQSLSSQSLSSTYPCHEVTLTTAILVDSLCHNIDRDNNCDTHPSEHDQSCSTESSLLASTTSIRTENSTPSKLRSSGLLLVPDGECTAATVSTDRMISSNNNINNKDKVKKKKVVKATLNGIVIHNTKKIIPVISSITTPSKEQLQKSDQIKENSPQPTVLLASTTPLTKNRKESLLKISPTPSSTSSKNSMNKNSAKKLYNAFFKTSKSKITSQDEIVKASPGLLLVANSPIIRKKIKVDTKYAIADIVVNDENTHPNNDSDHNDCLHSKEDDKVVKNLQHELLQLKTTNKEKKSYSQRAFNHFKLTSPLPTSNTTKSMNNTINITSSRKNATTMKDFIDHDVKDSKQILHTETYKDTVTNVEIPLNPTPCNSMYPNSAIIGDVIPIRKKGSMSIEPSITTTDSNSSSLFITSISTDNHYHPLHHQDEMVMMNLRNQSDSDIYPMIINQSHTEKNKTIETSIGIHIPYEGKDKEKTKWSVLIRSSSYILVLVITIIYLISNPHNLNNIIMSNNNSSPSTINVFLPINNNLNSIKNNWNITTTREYPLSVLEEPMTFDPTISNELFSRDSFMIKQQTSEKFITPQDNVQKIPNILPKKNQTHTRKHIFVMFNIIRNIIIDIPQNIFRKLMNNLLKLIKQ